MYLYHLISIDLESSRSFNTHTAKLTKSIATAGVQSTPETTRSRKLNTHVPQAQTIKHVPYQVHELLLSW